MARVIGMCGCGHALWSGATHCVTCGAIVEGGRSMYVEMVGKHMDDDLYWSLMESIRAAVEERGCAPATEDVLDAWIGNVTRMLQDNVVPYSFIAEQVKLYAKGVSGVEISDFMTILPCTPVR